jgi:hypothetical protein
MIVSVSGAMRMPHVILAVCDVIFSAPARFAGIRNLVIQ